MRDHSYTSRVAPTKADAASLLGFGAVHSMPTAQSVRLEQSVELFFICLAFGASAAVISTASLLLISPDVTPPLGDSNIQLGLESHINDLTLFKKVASGIEKVEEGQRAYEVVSSFLKRGEFLSPSESNLANHSGKAIYFLTLHGQLPITELAESPTQEIKETEVPDSLSPLTNQSRIMTTPVDQNYVRDYAVWQRRSLRVIAEHAIELYTLYFPNPESEEEWRQFWSLVLEGFFFISSSIVSGVIGNLAYDAFKKALNKRSKSASSSRAQRWAEFERDFDRVLNTVLERTKRGENIRVVDVAAECSIEDRERVKYLFKFMGGKHIFAGSTACSWLFVLGQSYASIID